jgi:hypothetical protein
MSSKTGNEADMSKLTVGISHGNTVNVSDHSREGRMLYILGIIVICVMLTLPMMTEKPVDNVSYDDAVQVMSGGVEGMDDKRDEDMNTSTEEKWSLYDYIGEMFAELIFGNR